MSYYYYKIHSKETSVIIPQNVSIRKSLPHMFVEGMEEMRMSKKRFLYYFIITFVLKGFRRKFVEYDVCKGDKIVSKALLMTKVPNHEFLPMNGIHICYCETIAEERGNGYYPMLLRYILNKNVGKDFYMIVKEQNVASIKGIEKAGFIRFAEGELTNGHFVITKMYNNI